MSYEMNLLRKEDLSLYYHIKHIALVDFIEEEELAPLTEMQIEDGWESNVYVFEPSYPWANDDPAVPLPSERGRGWAYLDCATVSGLDDCSPYVLVSGTDTNGDPIDGISEQSSRIAVYDAALNSISDALYMVDYMDGRIITFGDASPAYIDYAWNYVSVVDEWSAVEASNPPVVVIDMHGVDKAGYQLGGGKKSVRRVNLHVFASNPAERNDIAETLHNALFNKSCPLFDFVNGTMLDHDGTWYGRRNTMNKLTSLFNRTTSSEIIGNLTFENVTVRHVSLPLVMTRDRNEVILSDLNAYRSKVSFDLVSYTNI